MGASYRATAHVGPFNQGDVVELDEANPEHAGLLRSGWFELVAVSASGVPLDLAGYAGPINEEYRELFAQPDITVTLPWNLGNAAPVMTEPGCSHPLCILDHPHAGPAILGPPDEPAALVIETPSEVLHVRDEGPGGAGPDARPVRRRKPRSAVRVRDDAAGAEPGAGAGPEGHGESGK